MSLIRNLRFLRTPASISLQRACMGSGAGQMGDLGSGTEHGGGGGGSIRSAGGAFGKREAAFEEEYFHRQQAEQLAKLRQDLHDEIHFHEEQIKRHQEAIDRHQQRVQQMEHKDK